MDTMIIVPPDPVISYKYHCDSEFYLEPLKDMLKDKDTYGLIALDRREATIGILKGKITEMMKHVTSGVPGKHRKGGQSARRFQQLRLIAINEFYKRIGDHANGIFLNLPPKELKGILIGGPSPTKEEFVDGNFLHHELQAAIVGVFDVAYTDESGLHELVDNAEEKLISLDLMKEKKVIMRFMKELIKDHSHAAYGEEEVREHLIAGAIGTLILSEDLRKIRGKVVCPTCNVEKDITLNLNNRGEPDIPPCPDCSNTRNLVSSMDLVEELFELANKGNAKVEIISTEFEEGDQLMIAFGGIAALLRYRLR